MSHSDSSTPLPHQENGSSSSQLYKMSNSPARFTPVMPNMVSIHQPFMPYENQYPDTPLSSYEIFTSQSSPKFSFGNNSNKCKNEAFSFFHETGGGDTLLNSYAAPQKKISSLNEQNGPYLQCQGYRKNSLTSVGRNTSMNVMPSNHLPLYTVASQSKNCMHFPPSHPQMLTKALNLGYSGTTPGIVNNPSAPKPNTETLPLKTSLSSADAMSHSDSSTPLPHQENGSSSSQLYKMSNSPARFTPVMPNMVSIHQPFMPYENQYPDTPLSSYEIFTSQSSPKFSFGNNSNKCKNEAFSFFHETGGGDTLLNSYAAPQKKISSLNEQNGPYLQCQGYRKNSLTSVGRNTSMNVMPSNHLPLYTVASQSKNCMHFPPSHPQMLTKALNLGYSGTTPGIVNNPSAPKPNTETLPLKTSLSSAEPHNNGFEREHGQWQSTYHVDSEAELNSSIGELDSSGIFQRQKSLEPATAEQLFQMFVTSIPRSWNEAKIKHFLELYEAVHDVSISYDRKRRSRKICAFVNFYSIDSAFAVRNALNNVKTLPGMHSPIQMRVSDFQKIFVGMLSKKHDEMMIFNMFSRFGHILDIYIFKNLNGQSKGCAKIEFSSRESALRAIIIMHQSQLMEGQSFPLVVKFFGSKKT